MLTKASAILGALLRSEFISLNDLRQICVKFVPQPRPIKTIGDRKRVLIKMTKTLIFQGLSRSGVVLERPNIGGVFGN